MSVYVSTIGDAYTLDIEKSSVDMRNQYLHLYRIMVMSATQLQRKNGLDDISIYCVRGTEKIIKREILLVHNKLSGDNTNIKIKEISQDDDTTGLKIGYAVAKDTNGRDLYIDIYASSETTYSNIYSQIVFSTYPTFVQTMNELVAKSELDLTII